MMKCSIFFCHFSTSVVFLNAKRRTKKGEAREQPGLFCTLNFMYQDWYMKFRIGSFREVIDCNPSTPNHNCWQQV